jgi:heme exporter protein B
MTRPSTFAQYRTLLAKDLRHEFRTREMLTSMGLYAVLVLIVFGIVFALLGHDIDAKQLAGGLVWVLIVFTSLLGLGRSFAFEKESSCIEGLLLVPMDRSVIYLAKLTSNLLFLLAVEVIVLPLFYFFFLTSSHLADSFACSILPVLLGTLGISAVGTLLSSITANARGRDVLLAVLFIPVAFPLLYACVGATTACIVGADGWLDVFRVGVVMAGAYDIVMTLASWLLYDYVVG